MPATASRIAFFTESVIREMTRIADQYGAINLAQGFPDFDPPGELLDAAARALRDGYNQYTVPWGSPRFRQALAEKQTRFMGLEIDADAHITVTCGSTEAMMAALMAVCNPGYRVIVFSPFYENYGADAILSGAEPVFVPLHPPDFRFDPDELRAAFRQGVKFCIWMAREIGLAAVPGSSFFHEPVHNLIRLNFAKREETLAQVEERLALLASKRPQSFGS